MVLSLDLERIDERFIAFLVSLSLRDELRDHSRAGRLRPQTGWRASMRLLARVP